MVFINYTICIFTGTKLKRIPTSPVNDMYFHPITFKMYDYFCKHLAYYKIYFKQIFWYWKIVSRYREVGLCCTYNNFSSTMLPVLATKICHQYLTKSTLIPFDFVLASLILTVEIIDKPLCMKTNYPDLQ